MTPEAAGIFAAKEERRRALACLTYPQKVQAVMQLQRMTSAILNARGKRLRPWDPPWQPQQKNPPAVT